MHKIIIAGNEVIWLSEVETAIKDSYSYRLINNIDELINEITKNPDLIVVDEEMFLENKSTISEKLTETFRTQMLVTLFNGSELLASHELEDKLNFIIQPFNEKEFKDCVDEIFRRCYTIYSYEDLTIDEIRKEVSIENTPIVLTPLEYDLLIYLKTHYNETIKRDELIRRVWGYNFLGDSRTIDTHIKSLRNKLGCYRNLIKTVWGYGYKFQVPNR